MKIFISGGSGSLGRAIARKLQHAQRVVIYSRTEGRQQDMAQELPEGGASGIRYFLGDICDYDRLRMAVKGCLIVVHCAAMKMIDSCTYNVFESVKNNVHGTENIAKACLAEGVKQALFISSDKACNAVSSYGSEKFLGEQIFISSNHYGQTRFNCVRYGNVIGSAKSAFHLWKQQAEKGEPVTVTHKDMTRFYWQVDEAADFVIKMLQNTSDRGCIYIPKMKSYKISDIAKTYSDKLKYTGIRCPEKIHEELVSETEAFNTCDRRGYYVIYPSYHEWSKNIEPEGVKVPDGFKLSSKVKNVSWK